MPRIVILPVLFCLISILTVDNVYATLTFGTSSMPYETLETEHFIVRYEPGDEPAARDVSEALEDSYEKITNDLGLAPSSKTVVELYVSPELISRHRKPAPWAVRGKIYQGRSMMVFQSPSTWSTENNHRYEDLWRVMPHEFVHLVLRRYSLPMWLDEGIAVYESSQWGKGYQRLLREALEKEELLSLRELGDFNTFIAHGALSYAESYTAVIYVKTAYGGEALRKLLGRIALGWSFEDALQAATGKSWDEFEEGWRRYLGEMLEPERQVEVMFRTLGDARAKASENASPARAETSHMEASEKAASSMHARKEELPSPWPRVASFVALLVLALFVRTLKALTWRSPKASL